MSDEIKCAYFLDSLFWETLSFLQQWYLWRCTLLLPWKLHSLEQLSWILQVNSLLGEKAIRELLCHWVKSRKLSGVSQCGQIAPTLEEITLGPHSIWGCAYTKNYLKISCFMYLKLEWKYINKRTRAFPKELGISVVKRSQVIFPPYYFFSGAPWYFWISLTLLFKWIITNSCIMLRCWTWKGSAQCISPFLLFWDF